MNVFLRVVAIAVCSVAAVKKASLNENMLTMETSGIDSLSQYSFAVDGSLNQDWGRCTVSGNSDPVWLFIDLGQPYSVTLIKLLSRLEYGRGAQIFVGQNANTTSGYRCGSDVVFPYSAPTTLTNFSCSPVHWVRYVSVRRTGFKDGNNRQYLQVCEVEVYYDETTDPGVSITINSSTVSAANVTSSGDVLLCGSPQGVFDVTWKFPDGTRIPEETNSASLRQANASAGYKELHLSPLTQPPPSGRYICEYKANGVTRDKTVSLSISGPPGKCSRASGSSDVGSSIRLTIARCPLNGNVPVTKYRVNFRIYLSGADWTILDHNSSSQPFLLESLVPYTKYEIRVEAGNRYGYGPRTNPVTVRTVEGKPGPPTNVKAVSARPDAITVSWSLPYRTYGLINNYRIYYKNSTESVLVVQRSSQTMTANLTELSPYTAYTIAVAAVNIRSSDSASLLGDRSTDIVAKTAEGAPSAPLDVSWTHLSLKSVDIHWKQPKRPNGILRGYVVSYGLAGGFGSNVTLSVLPGETSQRLYGLQQLTMYAVSIQARTTVVGDVARIIINTDAFTPGWVEELKTVDRTSSSLLLSWKSPINPNGVVKGYRLYYWRLDKPTEILSLESLSSQHNLTDLRSYTYYGINVTVVNNAAARPESQPIKIVNATSITEPDSVMTVFNETVRIFVSNGSASLLAPRISDENVPVSYIKIYVYSASNPSPYSSLPPTASENSEHWHLAAFYDYNDYVRIQRHPIIIGSGNTTNDGVNVYTDKRLVEEAWYSVYFVAYLVDSDSLKIFESSSGPTSFLFAGNACEDSVQSVSTAIFSKTVELVLISFLCATLVALIITVSLLVVLRRRNSTFALKKASFLRNKSGRRKSDENDMLPKDMNMTVSSAYIVHKKNRDEVADDNAYVEVGNKNRQKTQNVRQKENDNEQYVDTGLN